MRLLILLVIFLIVSSGCAAIRSAVSDYDACLADMACVERVQKVRAVTHEVVSGVTQVDVLGGLAGGLSALLAGLIYIRKKKKRS